jgi:biopolymer transport protein ExbD
MRRREGGLDRLRVTHIDMVPMVDCVMVLVIFLMISSSFVSDPGVVVQKPDVGGTMSNEQNSLIIAITSDDRIWFDGQEVRADQVAGVLRQASIGRSPVLIVRGDKASSLGIFARVYDEAKRAGIANVQFATAREEGG